MKRLLFFFLIILLAQGSFTGCKKSNAEKAVRRDITGSWELKQTSGMLTTNYPPGSGNVLQFTASAFKRYTNGRLAQSGTYKIVADNTVSTSTCLVVTDGQYKNRIVFSNDRHRKVFMQLSDTTLLLLSGCFAYDAGTSSTYTRIENPALSE